MNNTASATIQYYTPRVYNALADVVSSTFLFGALTILSVVSAGSILHRGVKHASTAFMLCSVVALYASTAVHFSAIIVYSVRYCRLLEDAAALLSPSSSSTSTTIALSQFIRSTKMESYLISAALAVNVTLGDAIVWWRVCVLWRKKWTIALGIFLIAATFVLGIVSSIHRNAQIGVYTQLFLDYGDAFGGLAGALSLLTNMLATLLIGYKAWKHRQVLRQGSSASTGRTWITPTMKVLLLLVESGTIYSIFLIVAVAYNAVSRSPSALTSDARFVTATRTFLTACFTPILAIYPTIIIFIVALNRSLIDNSLANPTSGITSTIAFRSSPPTMQVSLSRGGDARSSHSDHSTVRPGSRSGMPEHHRKVEISQETTDVV